MIDVYFWMTPNGYKVTIALEELGMPYNVIPINIGKGDQFKPEFLKVSPNNKIPAMVDSDGPGGKPISLFESGAILIYLAEKSGKLMPKEPRGRYNVLEWLMFQMASVGPMLGQAHHFRRYAPEQIQYAIDRYTNEAKRIYNVIDKRLAEVPYLAGDYSIADIATYPWLRPHKWQGQELENFPHLKRWYDELEKRPAVQKGCAVMAEHLHQGRPTRSRGRRCSAPSSTRSARRKRRRRMSGADREHKRGHLPRNSTGRHVFVDDVGPGPRPSEKLRLVRSNLLADAWSREPGHPGEKRGPVGKSQFCHDVEVDRAAFLSQFLAPHKVSAFVNDGSGRQAADQREVFIFVVIDKILHLDAFSLGEKAKYLKHGAPPAKRD